MRLSANLTSLTSSILAFSSHLVPGAPSNTTALGRRSVSEYLGPLVLRVSRRQEQIRMASQRSQDDVEKLNVLGGELQQHGINPTTGFFRDGYCRPSTLDPAEHTLAGVLTKEFLEFSKDRGNDLMTPRGGFPGLKSGCRWCLCVSRWKEALLASSTHPAGSRIVPLVNLNGTSITVLGEDPKRKVTMEEIRRFEEGRKMA